jgi:hypothetical protein
MAIKVLDAIVIDTTSGVYRTDYPRVYIQIINKRGGSVTVSGSLDPDLEFLPIPLDPTDLTKVATFAGDVGVIELICPTSKGMFLKFALAGSSGALECTVLADGRELVLQS